MSQQQQEDKQSNLRSMQIASDFCRRNVKKFITAAIHNSQQQQQQQHVKSCGVGIYYSKHLPLLSPCYAALLWKFIQIFPPNCTRDESTTCVWLLSVNDLHMRRSLPS